MSQFDYKLVIDVNRAYAVNGSRGPLDDLFTFLKRGDFEEIYDDADISEEHRDLGYESVREYDFNNVQDAQECVDFMASRHDFEGDVLIRVRNADDAPEDIREDFEHAIKSFHEQNSFGPEDDVSTCVLVSGTDSLTQYDFTLGGRIFSPPELR